MYKVETHHKIHMGLATDSFIEYTIYNRADCDENGNTQNYEFLLGDIESYSVCDKFIMIDLVFVAPVSRRKGIGTQLVKLVQKLHNLPIVIKVGAISEEEYEYHEGSMQEYLAKEKVPFYESNGFININDTGVGQSDYVIMAYPESFANKFRGD